MMETGLEVEVEKEMDIKLYRHAQLYPEICTSINAYRYIGIYIDIPRKRKRLIVRSSLRDGALLASPEFTGQASRTAGWMLRHSLKLSSCPQTDSLLGKASVLLLESFN